MRVVDGEGCVEVVLPLATWKEVDKLVESPYWPSTRQEVVHAIVLLQLRQMFEGFE